jgi:hypothetical protein
MLLQRLKFIARVTSKLRSRWLSQDELIAETIRAIHINILE